MQIETNNLFGGSLAWDRVTQKETDIDKSTLHRIRQGVEGFSAQSARKAADVTGEEAAHIYLSTQTRAIKTRRDQGELDDGGTLKAVGRLLSTLKSEFPEAMISKDQAKAIQDLAAEASKSGATPTSQMERLGRDGGGMKVQRRGDQENAATKENVPGTYGALGRRLDGTAARKAM